MVKVRTMDSLETNCKCGRAHNSSFGTIVVETDLWTVFLEYLKGTTFKRLLLVADLNTYEVLGHRAHVVLSEAQTWDLQVHVFATRAHLVPDDGNIKVITEEIRSSGAECVLAIGSGVINDIVRYATFLESIPYISLPTAPSMDGYTSTVAALQLNGVKTTLPAHGPLAIFTSPSILRTAPFELIQAGYGDLVGKAISIMDWKLSRGLYQEYFCPQAYKLVLQPLQYIIENAERIRNRDPEAIQVLFEGLINSGIAIAMVGNSRPASGSEHHCSHFWDFLAFKGARQFHSHGLQVGYATSWMIKFYQALAENAPIVQLPVSIVTREWMDKLEGFYGTGASAIRDAQQEKQEWLLQRQYTPLQYTAELIPQLEPEFSMLNDVEKALHMMGLSELGDTLELNKEILSVTFRKAKELRARYTIFDFYEGQGRLETVLNHVLEQS
jgi:glycerol-1-phosphate dehydrogenase [NAD(P)+]